MRKAKKIVSILLVAAMILTTTNAFAFSFDDYDDAENPRFVDSAYDAETGKVSASMYKGSKGTADKIVNQNFPNYKVAHKLYKDAEMTVEGINNYIPSSKYITYNASGLPTFPVKVYTKSGESFTEITGDNLKRAFHNGLVYFDAGLLPPSAAHSDATHMTLANVSANLIGTSRILLPYYPINRGFSASITNMATADELVTAGLLAADTDAEDEAYDMYVDIYNTSKAGYAFWKEGTVPVMADFYPDGDGKIYYVSGAASDKAFTAAGWTREVSEGQPLYSSSAVYAVENPYTVFNNSGKFSIQSWQGITSKTFNPASQKGPNGGWMSSAKAQELVRSEFAVTNADSTVTNEYAEWVNPSTYDYEYVSYGKPDGVINWDNPAIYSKDITRGTKIELPSLPKTALAAGVILIKWNDRLNSNVKVDVKGISYSVDGAEAVALEGFDADVKEYTVNLAWDNASVDVDATYTTELNSSLEITGDGELAIGNNVVRVAAKAEDGTEGDVYTITFVRPVVEPEFLLSKLTYTVDGVSTDIADVSAKANGLYTVTIPRDAAGKEIVVGWTIKDLRASVNSVKTVTLDKANNISELVFVDAYASTSTGERVDNRFGIRFNLAAPEVTIIPGVDYTTTLDVETEETVEGDDPSTDEVEESYVVKTTTPGTWESMTLGEGKNGHFEYLNVPFLPSNNRTYKDRNGWYSFIGGQEMMNSYVLVGIEAKPDGVGVAGYAIPADNPATEADESKLPLYSFVAPEAGVLYIVDRSGTERYADFGFTKVAGGENRLTADGTNMQNDVSEYTKQTDGSVVTQTGDNKAIKYFQTIAYDYIPEASNGVDGNEHLFGFISQEYKGLVAPTFANLINDYESGVLAYKPAFADSTQLINQQSYFLHTWRKAFKAGDIVEVPRYTGATTTEYQPVQLVKWADAQTDASANVTADGEALIAGEDGTYAKEVARDTESVEVVIAPNNVLAVGKKVEKVTSFPATVETKVVAEDGTEATYTVKITKPVSADKSIKSIKYGETAIDVVEGETVYTVEFEAGADLVVTANSEYAEVSEVEITGVGEYVVTVKAENGDTVTYTFNVIPPQVELVISANGGSVVNAENVSIIGTKSYDIYTALVLTAAATEGYKFAYWVDEASGRIVSEEEVLELTLISDKKLSAVFNEESDTVKTVIFRNKNGQIAKRAAVGVDGTVEVPTDPFYMGYKFAGWKDADGNLIENLTEVVWADVASVDGSTVEYTAHFEKGDGKYLLTLESGAATPESDDNKYEYDTKITVSANAAETGMVFSHWIKDDEVVSYDNDYSFFMGAADTTLKAAYDTVAPAKLPVIAMTKAVPLTGEGKIAFFAERNLYADEENGRELIETGILVNLEKEDFEMGKDGTLKATSTSKAGKGQFTVRKANLKANDHVYAMAYMTYKDAHGIHTVFSNVVTGIYN